MLHAASPDKNFRYELVFSLLDSHTNKFKEGDRRCIHVIEQNAPRRQPFAARKPLCAPRDHIAWWKVDKRDYFGKGGEIEMQAMGSLHSTFPNPESWNLDGESVDIASRRFPTRRNSKKIQNVFCMVPCLLTGFITLSHPFSASQTFLYQQTYFHRNA